MGPGVQTNSYKACPQCGTQSPMQAAQCPNCGHVFPQTFAPPAPGPGFPPNPNQAFTPPPNSPLASNPQYLAELARRSNDSQKVIIITFIVGLFCLWPVWIITYLEYVKFRDIRDEVGKMGIDVGWWQSAYGAKSLY